MRSNGKRLSVIILMLAAFAFAFSGCSGSDGAAGAPGTPGKDAPTPVVALAETAVETCNVCHADGREANVDTAHGKTRYEDLAVSNIVVTAVGANLEATFNVKVNGVNKTNYDGFYRRNATSLPAIYRLEATTLDRITLDSAVTTLTGGTSGNYKITLPGAAANPNSRYMLIIWNAAEYALPSTTRPAGARAIVLFDYPASPVTDYLGTSTSCADCHGTYGNGFHYGYPSYGGKTCVVCHDSERTQSAVGGAFSATNYPRLPAMIHGIHKSAGMPTGKHTVYTRNNSASWEYKIKFPSYMDNCSICHQSGAPLTAANSKAVGYDFCMTCHQSWDGFTGDVISSFHKTMTAASNCAACHDGSVAPATVGATHNKAVLYTERDGFVYNGEDVSVTEGAKVALAITGVTRTGNNLAIKWTASYSGAAVNPCNATPGAAAPSFASSQVPVQDHGVYGPMNHNFSILKSFFQGDDPVNANNGATSPGQPLSTNLTFTGATPNTTCSANVATTTITLTTAEAALTGNARVAIQGKPIMKHTASGYNIYVRAKAPIYDFKLADGSAIAARRNITDTALCLKCHVGSLYQHGGTRVDNVELCVMCHNEASSEQNVRVGMGVTASEAYDGKVGQTYGLKTMLHAAHASGETDSKALLIYRTRGIYAWAPDVTQIPNWPGTSTSETDKKLVYGADPAGANAMQPHNFATAHYPRALQDCMACHKSTFSRMPDPAKAVGTTINAGAAPWDKQLDDVIQGPTTAACTSCHQSAATVTHANQFGWTPAALKNGRQTVIDSAK